MYRLLKVPPQEPQLIESKLFGRHLGIWKTIFCDENILSIHTNRLKYHASEIKRYNS